MEIGSLTSKCLDLTPRFQYCFLKIFRVGGLCILVFLVYELHAIVLRLACSTIPSQTAKRRLIIKGLFAVHARDILFSWHLTKLFLNGIYTDS